MHLLIALGVLAIPALFTWLVIRGDERDRAAYNRWYNDPRHVWNPSSNDEEQP